MIEAGYRSNYLCKLEQDSPLSIAKTEPAQSETEMPSACPRKLPHKSTKGLLPDSTVLQTNNRQQWDLALEMKATCPVWQPTCFIEAATAARGGRPAAGHAAPKGRAGGTQACIWGLQGFGPLPGPHYLSLPSLLCHEPSRDIGATPGSEHTCNLLLRFLRAKVEDRVVCSAQAFKKKSAGSVCSEGCRQLRLPSSD